VRTALLSILRCPVCGGAVEPDDYAEHHHTLVEVLRWGNFITPPIEAIRDVLFWGRLPRLGDVVYLCVAAVLALALGAWVFRRVDDRIAVEL
jgi:ABC-type polysaccharide/polyol phosphate export permease